MTSTTPAAAAAEPGDSTEAVMARVRTPWWRRITALISLGSLVMIIGMVLAAVTAAGVLLFLMFLERAAG